MTLQNATISVQYVNPPKKPGWSSGSVKDQDGKLWSVPKAMLAQFQPGCTYQIEYEQTGDWPNVKTAKPVGSPSPAPQQNGSHYRRRSPTESEQIFVQGILQAAIKAGKVDLKAEALIESVNRLRTVYQATFGQSEMVAEHQGAPH